MRTTLCCLLATLFALSLSSSLAAKGKDDKDKGPKKHESRWAKKLDEDPVVKEVDREEAKKLLAALTKAVKTKEAAKIIAAVEPMITRSNERFFKDLAKLAKDKKLNVRIVSLKALGSQKEPVKKITSTLFGILRAKPFKHSGPTLAMAIDSLRRQNASKKQIVDEIESHFKKVKHRPVMKACVRYFGDLLMKDKVKLLVVWVEEPRPANVNSPTNPPASYWKARWDTWNEMKETVWYSLETITGKDFKTQREWEKWLRTSEAKRMGID